jgi:hypothetical protein
MFGERTYNDDILLRVIVFQKIVLASSPFFWLLVLLPLGYGVHSKEYNESEIVALCKELHFNYYHDIVLIYGFLYHIITHGLVLACEGYFAVRTYGKDVKRRVFAASVLCGHLFFFILSLICYWELTMVLPGLHSICLPQDFKWIIFPFSIFLFFLFCMDLLCVAHLLADNAQLRMKSHIDRRINDID